MASPDVVVGYLKLDTEFFTGYVQHITFRSDASQGRRQVKVVKKWYRDRELGRGSFGTVFLEKSEKGEYRAVKEIAKDKNSMIKVDYRRELMAMASLAKHDALFVQLLGWYESDNYVHIAMEYISHGHLRNYLEVERSESEAKVITRQLLEGLAVLHQEGFAHRDLKPENIFVVSASPVWVKIGDFGLAKLARDGTAFRTQAFSLGYSAPEMGVITSGDSSEYTNAVDIWAVGCITYEILTRARPFPNISDLSLYCARPEFPRNSMLLKNISQKGIEIVERMLILSPERRITAEEALDSEWLRLGEERLETNTTKITDVLGATTELSSVPCDEEYQFFRRSTVLQKWNGLIGLRDKDQGRTPSAPRLKRSQGARTSPYLLRHPRLSPKLRKTRKGSSAHTNMGDAKEHVGLAVIPRRQAKSLAINEPSTNTRMPTDGQKSEASVSRYSEAPNNPKPSGNIDPSVERVLESALKEMRENTSNPHEPVLSRNAVRMLHSGVVSTDIRDLSGNTPLHILVKQLCFSPRDPIDPRPLHALLASGADINAKNSGRETPLFFAVSRGSTAVTRELLELGANAEEPAFETPLHAAARLESDTICKLILERGVNINARDSLARTPLHRAVIHRRLAVAVSLVLAGADVEARDDDQRTALGYAVLWGWAPLVVFLLDRGANPDMVDKWGTSPRQMAARSNLPSVVAMFDRSIAY